MTDTLFDAPAPRKRGTGPTKVIDRILHSEKLMEWAWRRGKEGKPLHDQGAAGGGIRVHKHAELLAKGGRPVPGDCATSDEAAATEALLAWWDHVQPTDARAELRLDDGTYNGQLDLVFACRGCAKCANRWRCRECRNVVYVPDGSVPDVCAPCTKRDVAVPGSQAKLPGYWIADFKAVKSTAWPREKWFFQAGACYRRLWNWHAAQHGLAPSCGALVVRLHTDVGDSETIDVSRIDIGMAERAAAWYADVEQLERQIILARA
jgi:hypothetical protein